MGTKSKGKAKRKPTVKGPQLAIVPIVGRTRVLYAEPPQKVTGNPFLAVRVPRELLAAFKSHAKKKGTTTNDLMRRYMSKVTGVSLVASEDDNG